LVIDTGSTTIVNSGLLEATGAGGLMVNSALENSDGCNPNYPDRSGFPSLIAALSTLRDDRLMRALQ